MNNTYYEESGSGAVSNKVSVNRAQFLGKWIWMLFLLSIFSILLGILDNEYIKKAVPGIYMIGQILPSIFNAACGVILFKLSSEEKKYRIAGICTLISLIGSILAETLFRSLSPESLIIWMPLLIVGLVESYYENHAHSIVLRDMDDELSENHSDSGCFGGECYRNRNHNPWRSSVDLFVSYSKEVSGISTGWFGRTIINPFLSKTRSCHERIQ